MKKILLQLLFICTFAHLPIDTFAQDSSHLRISLLTCTPGEELYSIFGHSAYRVIDSSSVTDIVYNYGMFDFNDEGFYIKFARGKLMYYVSAARFDDFKYEYQYFNRGITEQILNLTAAEKTTIQRFLNNNLKEENKYYKYDFFFDNCTTKLRDILKKNHDSSFTINPVMPSGTTFRQAIYQYLDKGQQHWSKLGIDLLLGKPCDAVMTAEQMQFLPDNLMKSLDSADHPMVLSHQNLYNINNGAVKKPFFTPFVVFTLLLILIFLISLSKHKIAHIFLKLFDWLLFFVTGLLGIILIFMTTATDHSMTKNNFNLLWAWPTHFIMAFFINSPQNAVHKKSWVKKYFAFTAIALVFVLLAWFFLPQHLNPALIPFMLLLIYRSAVKSIGVK
ncbi:Lnb N-terminal periplasmic domain-containing protein [Ferruginibacter sp.]